MRYAKNGLETNALGTHPTLPAPSTNAPSTQHPAPSILFIAQIVARLGDVGGRPVCDDPSMTNEHLGTISNQLADVVEAAAPSVVQVHGRRRPASGLVYGDDIVLTTARALGRGDGLHVRRHDGQTIDAELAGWDPTTSLAVLRAPSLGAPAIAPASVAARVGHLAIAVARSWSNYVTASAGIVSVIGGPLPHWPSARDRSGDPDHRTDA